MEKSILQKRPIWLSDRLTLERGRVHEIMGEARDSFAVTMASKISGPIVWIGRGRDVGSIAPSALKGFLDPTRIVLTEGTNRKEVLWAAEQVLRSKGAALVIIQLTMGPDLRESRRLQLAAEQGRTVGLILIERRAQSSASQTRWLCEPVAANDNPLSESWVWELTKNKAGPVGRWAVSWTGGGNGQTGHVHMVAASAA